MKKESETKTIEEWLRTVDKPMATKDRDKKVKKQKRWTKTKKTR